MIAADRSISIYLCIAGIAVLVSLASSLLWFEARERDTITRVSRALSSDNQKVSVYAGLVGWLHALGERFRRLYSRTTLDHLREVIVAAGFNPHRVLPILLGGKIVLMLLLPAVAAISGIFVQSASVRLLMLGFGIIAGIVGPELILGYVRRRFVAKVQRGTPDALDLLVVCSEAGMGLESALDRVSREMAHSNREMASVLASLLDDLRVLSTRQEAFANLGTRSGVEGLRRCGAMLSQSLEYGTPLSQALRHVAAELRRERLNKLEEKAVKLPAVLIFPMVVFIMPSLYIVLLGTSFLRLYDTLSTLNH